MALLALKMFPNVSNMALIGSKGDQRNFGCLAGTFSLPCWLALSMHPNDSLKVSLTPLLPGVFWFFGSFAYAAEGKSHAQLRVP